jgi:myo-inositol-1(or 4)-monophosphatase
VLERSDLLLEIERIAREAGRVALDERRRLVSELKPDGSVVTNGDRAVEEYLRRELVKALPGTGVWGEEFGYESPGPEGLWVVDPVDGTTNYSFHGLLWGVSIGLMVGDSIRLGVVYMPSFDELLSAEAGQGAWIQGERLKPIEPGPIRPHQLVSYDEGLVQLFPEVKVPGKMRCSGAFVVDGCFTAAQRFRGMVGRRERLYDIAACLVINEEVGADIRYVDGSPFRIDELAHGEQITRPWVIFPRDSGFFG